MGTSTGASGVIWTPTSGSVLINASEEQTNLVYTIVADGSGSTGTGGDSGGGDGGDGSGGTAPVVTTEIDSLTWVWDAEPGIFTAQIVDTLVSQYERNLVITIPNFLRVLPPIEIDYLVGNTLETTTDWNAIDPAYRDITKYLPHVPAVNTWTLTVTANPSGDVAVFTCILTANYSLGRDTLITDVNAVRRHPVNPMSP